MTDDAKEVLLAKPQAGQPVKPSETEAAKPSVDTETLAALIDERLENFSRKQQSQLDKLEARVKKQLQTVRAAGVEVTPEVEKAIRQAASEDETASPVVSETKPAQAKPQEPSKQAGWREDTRDELYGEYGFGLDATDPELESVDVSSPAKLTRTLTAALEAKKARKEAETTRGAQGRLPVLPASGPTSTNPIAEIRDPALLIQMGLTKK